MEVRHWNIAAAYVDADPGSVDNYYLQNISRVVLESEMPAVAHGGNFVVAADQTHDT